MLPVAPDTAIWFAVPASEVTPVFVMVTLPVAPETLMPVPATLAVTPVFVIVRPPAPTTAALPEMLMPVPLDTVEVATFANVFGPEK